MILVLILLGVYVLPRVVVFHDLTLTSNFTFADMTYHLYHVDLLGKQLTRDETQVQDPFLRNNPEVLERIHPVRWPPAVYYVTLPFWRLFGPMSVLTTQCTNLLATLLIILGVLGLGRLLGTGRSGPVGGLLCLLCPALVAASWYLSLDYPLIGMVLVGLLLLGRGPGFSRLWPSLLFGAFSALGLMVKASYALYLLAPSVVALVVGLYKGPRLRVLLHAAGATLLSLGLFALMNWPERAVIFNESLIDLRVHALSYSLPAATMQPLSLNWWLSQPIFAAMNVPLPLLLLALPGLVLMHTRRAGAARVLLVPFFWGTLIILTGMANKLERYLHPVYPLLCLVTAFFVFELFQQRIRKVIIGILVAIYMVVLGLAHIAVPTPWWTNRDGNSPRFILWNEYRMPTREVLGRLAKAPMDITCTLGPLVDQIVAWVEKDPTKRPLALAYLRPDGGEPLNFPYGELLLQVSQRMQDRFVVSGALYGQSTLQGGVPAAPNLVVVHPDAFSIKAVDPTLPQRATRVFPIRCHKDKATYALTLIRVAGP